MHLGLIRLLKAIHPKTTKGMLGKMKAKDRPEAL
jgi:hypothetical protein